MFYAIEDDHDGTYYVSGGHRQGLGLCLTTWTAHPDNAQTFGRFLNADQQAQYLAQLLGRRISVVRYDGAWIKTAKRSVIETHG